MKAAIDIGNSRCKIGFFDQDHLVEIKELPKVSSVPDLLKNKWITSSIISSVGEVRDEIKLKDILSKDHQCIRLSFTLPLPFKLNYETPQTLGTDRIAAIAGAQALFPKKNCLVIDTGTCITYDVITKESVYLGGLISPGMNMKFKAMHAFTARLPLIDEPKPEIFQLPAQNTENAMLQGVFQGTSAEIEGIIERFTATFSDLNVILCGGNSKFFESNLKHPIFVRSELVLIGLNSILTYNESN